MTLENFSDQIKKIALSSGADLVGIVKSKEIEKKAPKGHRVSNLLSKTESIIVLACGKKLNEDRYYLTKIGRHSVFNFILLKPIISFRRKRAVRSVKKVAKFLEDAGHQAVVEWCGWSDIISFKMAAYLSGLGVFGKGDFIVHPILGPINVLACIATDTSLQPGEPLKMDVCGDCLECIKACKYGAFKKKEEGFAWIREKCRCFNNAFKLAGEKGYYGPCNSECINSCPIGK